MTGAGYDYERHGAGYAARRRTDPRIAPRVHAALGDARTVVNVGAGAGSYEPRDRHVVAVEPAAAMRVQRPRELAPAIAAHAEALPLDDDAVDAAMAMVTIHHWADPQAGLRELRRVARGAVVVLTFDADALADLWLVAEYLPELAVEERRLFPAPADVARMLGGGHVEVVPVPRDCEDGFIPAFYARPEAYLDERVRAAQSVWRRLPEAVVARALAALEADLASGTWDERHGHLRAAPEHDGALRLVVSPGA